MELDRYLLHCDCLAETVVVPVEEVEEVGLMVEVLAQEVGIGTWTFVAAVAVTKTWMELVG